MCVAQGDVQKGARRLVVRQNDILLSATGTTSGVVTIIKPAQHLLLPQDPDVYLNPDRLHTLEDWIETETIVAHTATPPDSLRVPANGHKDDRVLDVKNVATGRTRKLDFYRVGRAGDGTATNPQVDLDLSKFNSAWEFPAKRDWFDRLRDECLNEWFSVTVSGKKLTRRPHWLLKITISETQFTIGYELDETGKHPKDEIGLGGADSTIATLNQKRITFQVSAIDFAPVFYNIADIDIFGAVEISGDDDMVLLKYRTDLYESIIAIPTATASDKGVKRATTQHMTAYPKAAV